MSAYAPLWVKSNFAFLEGASHPEELVERASGLGLPALALTDRDGIYGQVRAHVAARERGLKILPGAEVSVGEPSLLPKIAEPEVFARLDRIVLLAKTRAGWSNLCRLLSAGRQRCPKGHSLVTLEEVAGYTKDLVALAPNAPLLRRLRDVFDADHLFGAIARHHRDEDGPREARLRTAARSLGTRLVACNEVLYHCPSRRALQDVLACIRTGTTLSTAGTVLRGNAEHALLAPHVMAERFADAPEYLRCSLEIAERCTFSLADLRYVYPAETLPDGLDAREHLRNMTFEGAQTRYAGPVPDDVVAQLERELALIDELDYGGYFLTMWEIVRECRRRGILCQGRGSAANSAVCYCLGITAVDPVRMDLLFERFLSRERAEPPDIDLDIEHERREEIILWVYERYGRRHAAMVANFIRYRGRSAVRDVGKVLDLPQVALDRLSKLIGYHGSLGSEVLAQAGLDPNTPIHAHFLRLCMEIQDYPRHLSIHPGGFLLGSDPVDTMVPIEPATMEDRTVIQWDKYDVEDLGLFKVDLLGLGALSHIRRTLDLMRDHEGVDHEMATIPQDDPATYDLLCRGDTVGVFQVESRAQMAMLPRLRPRVFYDLVIEVAIVRPGPIQGDMVHPYLRRRKGEEEVAFPHPALERVLMKTLGVPIFQEQVMKLAIAVADYTPGEADQLRRDMAAWRSSGRIEAHRERLISRMIQHGIDVEFAERVFAQIRGFGEYGFPESHAASFALIAYVTAWLRTHHPAAFTCGLLNAQPMGFYSAATIVEDAKRRGVEVRNIDAQRSDWDCTLERGGLGLDDQLAVRMGLRWVRGLGERERTRLEAARARGPFKSMDDFIRRTNLNRNHLVHLAESGAFESFRDRKAGTGEARRDALWEVRGAVQRRGDSLELGDESARPNFDRLGRDEAILWDYRTSFHSARGHPIQAIRPELDRRGFPDARSIADSADGKRVRYVGMVICRQRPGTASGVTFYTLEDETGFVNLVVWRQVFERHEILAKTAMLMGVTGKVQSQDGVVHLIADELWEPGLSWKPDGVSSRDFH